ncbi:dehydrogenase [Agromyces rhizosphaerae]|uniref:Dehydrogenase n=1 Tax=Agromyces rhizosphaerae TaxID=88374 RepID=A0A9W6CXB0_9MICO|nr:2-hydroxyacid dehydrogenase [Agromyces rhizosphaerae]GLI27024.1 dehydrogenase [Agromyces rhizosphaerae]
MTDAALTVTVPDATLRDALGPLPEGVNVFEWDFQGPPPAPELDLVVPPYMGGNAVLRALEGVPVRLVQSQSIGYDGVAGVLPAGHVFANATTVHETSTAELALALVLAAQRGIPRFVRAADEGRWAPVALPSLADRRVLLLGYGGVGVAIEDRLLPFEAVVTRVASRARESDRGRVHGIDELPELLPDAEIVIVGLPLSDATRGLVDDAFLSALPDDALVVNVGRGPVADTDAILAHAHRLRFALDVVDPEPLPDGHPLFAAPSVLISPHVGGASSAMLPRMAALVRRQVAHLLAGEEPENVVLRT